LVALKGAFEPGPFLVGGIADGCGEGRAAIPWPGMDGLGRGASPADADRRAGTVGRSGTLDGLFHL